MTLQFDYASLNFTDNREIGFKGGFILFTIIMGLSMPGWPGEEFEGLEWEKEKVVFAPFSTCFLRFLQ